VKSVKKKIFKHLTHTKKNWVKFLPQITRSINATYSQALGMAPIEVNSKNEGLIWQRVYHKIIDMDNPVAKFFPGQLVRVSKAKFTFKKSYTASYSDEKFKIFSVMRSRPVVAYKLQDLKRNVLQSSFYEPELNLVQTDKDDDK